MARISEMLLGITAGILLPATSFGTMSSKNEINAAHTWASFIHDPGKGEPMFSFQYGEKPSKDLLSSWRIEDSSQCIDDKHISYKIIYKDPNTGLVVRCEAVVFTDFAAVDWILYFKNEGTTETPIIENVLPLDGRFALARDKAASIHHANGSEVRLDDFEPFVTPLGPNQQDPQGQWHGETNPLQIASKNGRSSCGALPFFNIEMADKGAMLAIGWTGDWSASFYRTDDQLCMKAGMQRTHFKLLPGEEVRSPKMMLLFWEGESLRGHNLLRQFILAHHTPTVNGVRAKAPLTNATWGGNFADKHIQHGLWWQEHGLPLDYLWVDAGWFGEDEAKEGATVFNSAWGRLVGDWVPNSGYFPKGLKAVSDALKQAEIGLLLWVEAERVFKGTTWTREHPEYLQGPIGDNYLFNLGDPVARKFLTDYLANLIVENNLGCYRQDFNMEPRPFWDAADAPDRVGIAEIRHITGLYAMWDELRERFPHLLIDNCSSGGRRIDLETISRSIPLWRSDVQCWPGFGITAMQGQTHGLGLWVPLSTGVCDREDTYIFRSALGPGMILIMYDFEQDINKHFSVEWLQAHIKEFQTVRDYFEGDFYPLISYSLKEDFWAAWQYHRPDLGEGMVLALRRNDSPFNSITARLHDLVAEANYEVRCLDTNQTVIQSGHALMTKGFDIGIAEQPGSKLMVYKKR
jgi:alpha-galactosidase